jgi:hypothetical protein
MGAGHLIRQALRLSPGAAIRQGFRYLRRLAAGRLEQALRQSVRTFVEAPRGPLVPPIPEIPRELLAGRADALRADADRTLRHEFDVLGSGPLVVEHGMACPGFLGRVHPPAPLPPEGDPAALVSPGNRVRARAIRALIDPAYRPVDWQLDVRSGHRWSEATWHAAVPYGHREGVDIKVPWELGRLQHLPRLALAFGLDGDARFRDEFRNQALDFLAANPPGFGVNWACPMDVAIRGANLVLAHGLFTRFGARFDEGFMAELAAGLLAHGRHVRANLEWHETRRGNHYLADLAGLAWIAAALPASPETTAWRTFAADQLAAETVRQIGPDGGGFEASTGYHRLSAEMLAWSLPLAPDRIGREQAERLFRAAEFSRDVTKPDGRVVQVGDNDGGRFFILFPDEDPLDHRSLVAALDGLFADDGLARFAGPERTLEAFLVAGLAGRKALDGGARDTADQVRISSPEIAHGEAETVIHLPDPGVLENLRALAYPDFGLYLWRGSRFFLSVRCGAFGRDGTGGHAHNDQLSIELNVDGEDWIADPGSFVYTADPDLRNAYRSVRAHAAPERERGEPSPLDRGLFRLEDRCRATCLRFDKTGFAGFHSAFPTPVRRTVALDRAAGSVTIRDSGPPGRRDLRTRAEVARFFGLEPAFSPAYGTRME